MPPDVHGDWSDETAPLPLPVPMPLPPGQVATVPTVSMCPPTVERPVGSTTVTESPGLTRYSCDTSRSAVTTGVVLVAVNTVPPPTTAPTEAPTEVTRIGPGSNTTAPSEIVPVAGRPRARCHRCTAAAITDE